MHRAAGVHHQIMLPGSPNFWTPLNPPPPQPPLAPPYMAAPPPPPVAGTHSQLSFSSFPPELFSLIEHPIPDCSFSHLLLGGLTGEDEKGSGISQFLAKKMDNWDTQFIKQESLYTNNRCNNNNNEEQFQQVHGNENHSYNSSSNNNSWSQMIPATSSPQSCITTNFNPNMLDFGSNNSSEMTNHRHNIPSPLATSRSSECNSNTPSGGAPKKAKVQPPSSTPTTIKVRKEKLGDRITALHQLVSPFGKTDTASVLLEAIGYIRFLQSQIEALSLPYLSGGSGNKRQTHPVKSGEKNSMFPEDPGQLLNENCLKRKGCLDQESYEEPKKDLRSRGLCLVPVSCTLHVGSENAADYWAPAFNAAFR